MSVSDIRADHQCRLRRARRARNVEISAALSLVRLAKADNDSTPPQPALRPCPAGFNPFCTLDLSLETADEAGLLELRAQTQAILARIGQRLDGPQPAGAEVPQTSADEHDVDMAVDDNKPTGA
jgi:hypothetical protein